MSILDVIVTDENKDSLLEEMLLMDAICIDPQQYKDDDEDDWTDDLDELENLKDFW